MVNIGGGFEDDVIVRTRCGWVKFRECGNLVYGLRLPLRLKGSVCRSYVGLANLYGSVACERK